MSPKTFLGCFITLVLAAPAQAADTLETKPKECNYSVSSVSGARSKSLICNDFDITFANTFTNVCAYRNGSWQYGHLKYDKVSKKHKFSATRVCDQGISVTPTQNTLNVLSPAVGDFVRGKVDIVTYAKVNLKPVYTSLLKTSPLKENEAPVLCYRGESRGVSVNAFACSREPNDVNYCEFTDVGSKVYVGNWWTQYRLSGKRKPIICIGGIKVTKLDEAVAEYAEDQLKVSVKTALNSAFLKILPPTSINNIPDLGHQIAACSTLDAKGKSVRNVCQNEETVAYDDWIDDIDGTRDSIRNEIPVKKFELGDLPSDVYQSLLPVVKSISTQKATIALLNSKIVREKNSDQKLVLLEILNSIMENIDSKVEARVEAIGQKYNGKYPMNKTALTLKQCGIDWDPSTNVATSAYVMLKVAGKLQKVNCQSIEYYSSQVIVMAK